MNFHSPAQPYFRSRANPHFLQQLNNQRVCPLWGDRTLWLSVGKMLLVFCPILLALHLWLASAFINLQKTVQAGEIVRYELMEHQMSLRAKRDQMLLPERVRVIAAEKLALHVPEKEQMTLIK
jgi:hypothetical protein